MRALPRRAALAGAVLLLASCAAYWSRNQDWAGDLIRVPHERHVKAGVDCVSCHEEIYDATALDKVYRPPEDKCMECHREVKEKGDCAKCHSDAKRARPYVKKDTHLVFNHAAHIERTKEDCATCHKKLPNPSRTLDMSPTMETCTECHEHKKDFADGKCDKCHTDLSHYPLKPVSAFQHQGNYVKLHARDARAATDRCASCHDQSFCTDCHAATVSTKVEIKQAERVTSDFIHRNDFITRHAMEAQFDQTQCRRCHGSSFCERCHSLSNLTPLAANPRNPHPPNYALPGAANFHGTAARRDIASCAPCHDQGARSICVDCHKVSGSGGNPHPMGWTDTHPRADIQKNGMCLYCHQ